MIFYYKSNNDFNIQVRNLQKDLDEQLKIYIAKKEILLKYFDTIKTIVPDCSENSDVFLKLSKLSENMASGLEQLSKNISDLENLKLFLSNSTSNLPNKFNYKNKKLMNIVKEYNKLATDCKNSLYTSTLAIDQLFLEYSENFKTVINNYILTKNMSDISNSNIQTKNPTSNNTSKTLVISEIQNKVILPYSTTDLEKILNSNSNYNTIQDVIDNEYTVPLSNFRNPRISRFKEAFNLMRKKENSSIADSLDLAFELSFNTLLNPAVIAACKNLDELDIYLDCLTSNELDKFTFFQVKYEILPKIVR